MKQGLELKEFAFEDNACWDIEESHGDRSILIKFLNYVLYLFTEHAG